jgi:hypothetical protein
VEIAASTRSASVRGLADAGPLAGAFAVAWRLYRADVIASLILFVVASLVCGRVWRFPVADEIFTLVPEVPLAARASVWALARFYLDGGDIHPPFTFLFFSTLYDHGVGETTLHFSSFAMTAAALALWQLLALAAIVDRGEGSVCPATRLVAILLFGLAPLAIGQGDAIRWYAQFALVIGVFATLYLAGGSRAARIASAIPLGLAASLNLIAPLVVLPLAIYRHLLERAWWPSFEAAFWAVFLVFASPGLYSAVFIAEHQLTWLRRYQFGDNPFSARAIDALGFFGGNAVGVGHAWMLFPAIVLTVVAIASQIDRHHPADPIHLCLLMLGAILSTALAGFSESRSFLYLAPVLALVLTLFIDRTLNQGQVGRAVLFAACAVLPGIVAVGYLASGTHPFKRTAAVSFDQVVDFIERNERGDTLVFSVDPVATWVLRTVGGSSQRCVVDFFGPLPDCLAGERRDQSIFIISEPSARYQNPYWNRPDVAQRLAARIEKMTRGREKVAEIHVGRDEDAMLKTRLTGVPLDEFILTVDLYR